VNRLLPGLLLASACASETPPPVNDSIPAVPVLADSLIYTFGDSTTIWLTPGRVGTAPDGSTCREHGVRVGTKLVPLLFVRAAPRIDDTGKIVAELSRDCRPIATYQIDLKTAQPIKVGGP